MSEVHVSTESTEFIPFLDPVPEHHEMSASAPVLPRIEVPARTRRGLRVPASQQEVFIREAFERVALEAPRVVGTRVYPIVKRVLDTSIASVMLLTLAPLLLLIALAIRLDSPGPALFLQKRVGQHGRFFTIFKFRSMITESGVRLEGIHKARNDQRVTRVGEFLRKTSLDELPQLINVLLGQMSLVGPRPELPEIMLQRYEPWQYQRLAVPQGVTGWWQVTGRGKKLLWKHTEDDMYYVERASIWFDLKLLLMTVRVVLRCDGAF